MTKHIRNSEELISDIARAMAAFPDSKLGFLEVVLYRGAEERLRGGLATVLGYLVDDIHWNQDGQWADADHVIVRPL